MSTNTTSSENLTGSSSVQSVSALSRRKKKALGRKKRHAKLTSDKEFSKQFFEAKSKRSAEKKSAFRKKKSKKK